MDSSRIAKLRRRVQRARRMLEPFIDDGSEEKTYRTTYGKRRQRTEDKMQSRHEDKSA